VSLPAAISVVLIFHVIFMARQYTGPTGQSYRDDHRRVGVMPATPSTNTPDWCAEQVRTRTDNFVLSVPCTAWPWRLHEISVPPISPPGPTPILSVCVYTRPGLYWWQQRHRRRHLHRFCRCEYARPYWTQWRHFISDQLPALPHILTSCHLRLHVPVTLLDSD
jgi:hypothetical protein